MIHVFSIWCLPPQPCPRVSRPWTASSAAPGACPGRHLGQHETATSPAPFLLHRLHRNAWGRIHVWSGSRSRVMILLRMRINHEVMWLWTAASCGTAYDCSGTEAEIWRIWWLHLLLWLWVRCTLRTSNPIGIGSLKRMWGCHEHQLASCLDDFMYWERYGQTARHCNSDIATHYPV